MTKLHFSDEVALPREVVTSKLAFLGQSGKGKTFAALKLAELMLEVGDQIIWCDVAGVGSGLRSSATGKGPGFEILLVGGLDCDVPINRNAGKVIANLVCDRDLSVILNTSDLDDDDAHRFYIDFFKTLFQRAKGDRRPRHVFIDEAQELVPEQLTSKLQAELLTVMRRWMKIGRVHGLGWSVIGQEPQAINKRVLGQAGALVLVQMTGEAERKALEKTARSKRASKADLQLMDVLPELKMGSVMLWSPGWLQFAGVVHLKPRVTFDSSATPEVGKPKPKATVRARLDLEQLRDAVSDLVKEEEAANPRLLQQQIVALRAELAKLKAAKPAPAPKAAPAPKPKAVEVPAITDKQVHRLEVAISGAGKTFEEMERLRVVLAGQVEILHNAHLALRATAVTVPVGVSIGGTFSPGKVRLVDGPTPYDHAPRPPTIKVARVAAAIIDGDVQLKGPAREMLRELAALAPRTLTRQEIANRCKLKPKNGNFRSLLSSLRTAGYIEDVGDDVRASAAGVAAAGAVTPKTCEEIVGLWAGKIKGKARLMLDALLAHRGGEGLTREQLAEAAQLEPGNGNFRSLLSSLRTSGLADEVGDRFHAGHALFLGEAA